MHIQVKTMSKQFASPCEVYERPVSPFVFDFLGQANRFEGENRQGVMHIGSDHVQLTELQQAPSGKIVAFVRPNELKIYTQPTENGIRAVFQRELLIAAKVIAELETYNGDLIEIELSPDQAKQHQFKPKQSVWVCPSRLHLFADEATTTSTGLV